MLHEKALLVTLNLSMFSPKKTDKRITKKVEVEHGAQRGTIRAVKTILPDEAVEPIRKLQGEMRTYHYAQTLPWSDEGPRLLPSTTYLAYQEWFRSRSAEHNSLVDNFVKNYPGYVESAHVALNGAFNALDYPNQDTIRGKFSVNVRFAPVPDAGDFRISIQCEEMAALRESVDQANAEATRLAINDLWRRMAEPLGAMVERLSDKKAVFRDTLVGNVRTIVEMIPALNITGDQKIESIRQRIQLDLADANPDLLRQNEFVRADTARKAQDILEAMSGFMQP